MILVRILELHIYEESVPPLSFMTNDDLIVQLLNSRSTPVLPWLVIFILDILIPKMIEKGFEFVTVSEIINK